MSLENICLQVRNNGQSVEPDMHDTQLTGAMVAQTYGAHQGAGETLAGFEASRDLQMVSEERDKDEDEDGRQGLEGEARQGASWWCWDDNIMFIRCAQCEVVLWVTGRDQIPHHPVHHVPHIHA
jgi:hypothetical protein